jgi:2-oxoglutarate dehydrogenase E2 component (dihydrolipoamide succinyltransferase)
MPAAVAEAQRSGVDLGTVDGTGRGGRILKEDVQRVAAGGAPAPEPEPAPAPAPAASEPAPQKAKPAPTAAASRAPAPAPSGDKPEERVRMSSLRRRIAERLVQAQQTAAILTTFNEADMSAVMALRKEFKQPFLDKHGIKLGFMSFFVKAVVEALRAYPSVNAEIDGDDLIYKKYFDIGVAVGGGKGLVVPVVRGCDDLSFAGIESEIGRLAGLARDNKLQISDLTGGTFTISNGGVYGSMLSTPILNPPQTGILGLHNIVQRPVAVDGKVEIRPVMYLALSYDHRVVDGREAVGFLVKIKECIEDPRRLMLEV